MTTIMIIGYIVGFFLSLFVGTFLLGWMTYFRESLDNITSVVWSIILLMFASIIWPVSISLLVLILVLSSIFTLAKKL